MKVLICSLSLSILLMGCARQSTVRAHYWVTDPIGSGDQRTFPETDPQYGLLPSTTPESDRIGVCFSGGGVRSASATLGELRGLKQIGLLQKITYISCVSGGSWAAVPFCFSPIKSETLLGDFRPPGELTTKDFDFRKGSLGFSIAHIDTPTWIECLIRLSLSLAGLYDNHLFASMLEQTLLQNLELEPFDRFVTANEKSRQVILAQNSGRSADARLNESDFVTPPPDRPFLIVNGTIRRYSYLPWHWDDAFNKRLPLEMTPLYIGLPHLFHDVGDPGQSVGGTYVEPIAYGASNVTTRPSEQIDAQIDSDRSKRFSIRDLVAISGAAPAEYELLARVAFPSLKSWSADNLTSTKIQEYWHGDGGLADNIGVMPLLARRVKNIIIFANDQDRGVVDSVRELFGQHTGEFGRWHSRGVFPNEKLQDLEGALARCHSGFDPVFADTYTVQNPAAEDGEDVFGLHLKASDPPYKVRVVWFFLDSTTWISNVLNPDVQQLLGRDEFKHFPHFNTFRDRFFYLIHPKIDQVAALAHMTSWLVVHNATLLEKEIAKPPVKSPAMQN